MRVLLVNKYTRVTGGADRHCLDLAGMLSARGHSVRFLSFTGGRSDQLGGAFVTPTVTHETRDRLSTAERIAVATHAVWNRPAAAAMRHLISEFKPDLVHTHKLYPQLSVAPVLVAQDARVPVIQTAHDYEFIAAHPEDDRGTPVDRRESSPSFRVLNTATFAIRRLVHAPRVTRWIAVSRFLASTYAQHGIACEVLENFVSPPGGSPPGYESRKGLLFSGRLTKSKGVKDVLELALRVPQLEITIAGTGPLATEVKATARELPNLHYAGFVQRASLLHLARKARLIVMPSRWAEPGPLTALEGMAAGTPIVTYSSGGLAEYVADAGAGLVVPHDVDSLARASRRIHDDPDLWHTHSRSALDAVNRVHAPERYVERLEGLYLDVVRRQGGVDRSPISASAHSHQ